MGPFFSKKIRDGIGEAFISEPMIGVCNDWFETTLDLVFPLGAGIKRAESMFDGVVLALVVTGFEVKKLVFSGTTPVAAKECFVVLEKQCGSDILAVVHGVNHKNLFGHCVGNPMEKILLQIALHAAH